MEAGRRIREHREGKKIGARNLGGKRKQRASDSVREEWVGATEAGEPEVHPINSQTIGLRFGNCSPDQQFPNVDLPLLNHDCLFVKTKKLCIKIQKPKWYALFGPVIFFRFSNFTTKGG